MKNKEVIFLFFLMWFPLHSMAAKPTSITFVNAGTTADLGDFSHYVVKCSNGKSADISAWNKRKLWCLGKGGKEKCNKKQIKTAKLACKNI